VLGRGGQKEREIKRKERGGMEGEREREAKTDSQDPFKTALPMTSLPSTRPHLLKALPPPNIITGW
jgi:hypothetical protein